MLEKLRGLAVFATVVKYGSFGGAAKELNITTSAVSQQIRSLETDLEVTLLHRSTRKISLTEAGETLYRYAKDMVSAAEQGHEKILELRDELVGCLRIASTPQIINRYIIPALTDWLHNNRKLSIHFICQNTIVDMIDERIDLQVLLSPHQVVCQNSIVLTKIKQHLLASPRYLDTHLPISTPNDLQSHTLIGSPNDDVLEFDDNGVISYIKPPIQLNTDDPQVAINLAKAGHGLVKVNELELNFAMGQADDLIPVLTHYSLPSLSLSAKTTAKENHPEKVQLCMQLLKEYVQ